MTGWWGRHACGARLWVEQEVPGMVLVRTALRQTCTACPRCGAAIGADDIVACGVSLKLPDADPRAATLLVCAGIWYHLPNPDGPDRAVDTVVAACVRRWNRGGQRGQIAVGIVALGDQRFAVRGNAGGINGTTEAIDVAVTGYPNAEEQALVWIARMTAALRDAEEVGESA